MKIAFINQPIDQIFPPSSRNSIGIITYEVTQRLAKSNEVIVYLKGSGIRKNEIWEKGVNFRFIPTAFDNRFLLKILYRFSKFYKTKRPLFSSCLSYFFYIMQIAIDLRMQNCDIVHIHNFSQFIPIIKAFNPDIKIVLHMHCEWMTQLDRTMIEKRLNKTDLIVGCSEYITENIRLRFPQFASQSQVIYNGVDINQFSRKDNIQKKNDGIRKLLFVGRVSPEKGTHTLLKAFNKVSAIYPQLQLEIVGPIRQAPFEYMVGISDDNKVCELQIFYDKKKQGSYFYKLQELIPKNLKNRVTFFNFVPQSQLLNYYLGADIFILPSICQEAFGMPIIEAMSCQVPIVATRSGGIPEIVEEGKSGLLVERGDVSSLAEAIIYLLSDDELREKMGKIGQRRVLELFSWDRISEDLLRKYKNIYTNQE